MLRVRYLPILIVLSSVHVAPTLGQRLPCTTVLRELHKVEQLGGLRGGDPGRIAKTLGTTTAWVERCASAFGRRLQSPGSSERRRLQQEPLWESSEPDELAREELDTESDVLVNAVPYRDKARARGFNRNADDWRPFELQGWEPSTRQWSPYLYDPQRTKNDPVPGLVRE